jgi:hypothetical protein
LEEPTAKEVARVHLHFITPALSASSWIPKSCEVLALSKNEDELNDIEESLSNDNTPEGPSSDFAGSNELQKVDSKGSPCQCWCDYAWCLFGIIMLDPPVLSERLVQHT